MMGILHYLKDPKLFISSTVSLFHGRASISMLKDFTRTRLYGGGGGYYLNGVDKGRRLRCGVFGLSAPGCGG